MERIGQYTIADELSRGPLARVVRARREDGGKLFAIKIDQSAARATFSEDLTGSRTANEPPPLRSDDADRKSFLASSDLQRRTAAVSRYWAPIHEVGDCEEGAYYVTDFYRRTARS